MAIPVIIFMLSYAATAGGPPTYEASWFTIDGGGGLSAGGQFTCVGTIGQPDVGVMTGGVYELAGGFWSSAAPGGAVSGDCDDDGDVDLVDYTCFFDCLTGPGGGLLKDCGPFDFDVDSDVDLHDSALFTQSFTGI